MNTYRIKDGQVSVIKGMIQKDLETYLKNFIDYYYTISNPELKNDRNKYEEVKKQDLAYLHRCDSIYIALDNDSTYIGGYAVNFVRPLRYFSVNDYYENYEKIMTILNGSDIEFESDICEITMIWKDNSRLSNKDMNWMYINSLRDAYRTEKEVIIGGAIHTSIAKKHKRVLSNTLYFGDVKNDMFEELKLGLVLFQYRKNLIWKLLSTLFDLFFNSSFMLMLFGKKDVPMRLPNMHDFSSFFQNKLPLL